MSGMLRSFRRRPSLGRVILQWLEYVLLLLAVTALGYFVWVKADAAVFQAYQSWRLDQIQQGKPASFGRFLRDLTPFSKEEPSAKPAPHQQPLPELAQPIPPPAPGRPPLESGDLVGKIRIPRLKLSAIVLEGTDSNTLRRAIGHLPGTALPGDPGNVDLAGHRDSFFRGLRDVKKGNVITMSTPSGDAFRYRVTSLAILPPTAMQTLSAYMSPGLTLITCYPFSYVGPAPKRYVVHADELNRSAAAEKRSAQNALDGTLIADLVSLNLDPDTRLSAADKDQASLAAPPSASFSEVRSRSASDVRHRPARTRTLSHLHTHNANAEKGQTANLASASPASRFPSLDLASEHAATHATPADNAQPATSESGTRSPEFKSSAGASGKEAPTASPHTTKSSRANPLLHRRTHKTPAQHASAATSASARSSGIRGLFRKLFKRGNN